MINKQLEEEAPSETIWKRSLLSALGRYKIYFPVIAASVLLILLGQILNSGFASFDNINNLLATATILGLASLGQTLVIIAGKEGIDLSVGAMMSMGAVMGALIANSSPWGLGMSILILTVIGIIVGLINGLAIQKLNVPPLVMTLAMTTVVNGFTLAYTKGLFSGMAPTFLQTIGIGRLGPFRIMIIIGIIVLIIVELCLRKSRYGASLYLIGSNRNASILAGIKTNRVVLFTYMIAGVIGTLSGLFLLAYTGTAQMGMANDYTLLSVAAVVIGGTSLAGGQGTYIGSFLGSLVLVVLSTVLVAVGMNSGVRELIQGLLLLLILIVYSRTSKLR